MLRRSRPQVPPEPNNLQRLLEWSYAFEAGDLQDPSLTDGTLQPGEHFAVRIGPVKQVTFAPGATAEEESQGATGTLVASDRRILLLDGTAVIGQWVWQTDVERVTRIANSQGLLWPPSPSKYAAGFHRAEGLVLPGYDPRGDRATLDKVLAREFEFSKVQVALSASQPGGVTAWRDEFRAKNAHLLIQIQ
jgi:hypothetical protein